jgi:signal transduction histidine kinase
VPADQARRLLEPFQRLDGKRDHHQEGLGLGLSIVAAIADAHHASLSVRPCHVGGGLAIDVTFPPAVLAPALASPGEADAS